MAQAKSRTYKGKKKNSFLNKTTILIGIIIVAIVGIAAIFVSNASGEETAAFKQDIYCNQGKCAGAPFAGAQKAEAFVRLSNKCATNQQWAAKKTKAAADWVCLERVPSSLPFSDGLSSVPTDCYVMPVPAGSDVTHPNSTVNSANACNSLVRFAIPDTGVNFEISILPFADTTQNYRQAAAAYKTSVAQTATLKFENKNYNIGGKPAVAQIFKDNTTNVKTLHVFVNAQGTIEDNPRKGLHISIPYYSQTQIATASNEVIVSRIPTNLADQTLNEWIWR